MTLSESSLHRPVSAQQPSVRIETWLVQPAQQLNSNISNNAESTLPPPQLAPVVEEHRHYGRFAEPWLTSALKPLATQIVHLQQPQQPQLQLAISSHRRTY